MGDDIENRYVPSHPFIAGGITGVIEILITYPLEYVKVQLQLQDVPRQLPTTEAVVQQVGGGGRPFYQGPVHVLRHTLATRGFTGLYVGLPAWLLFAFPRSAIRFTVYETVIHRLAVSSSPNSAGESAKPVVSGITAMTAGLLAGMAESATCLTPLLNIQVKMTHDLRAPERRFKGFWHALYTIPREYGVRKGLFSGLVPCVCKGAVNNCIRFSVVNELSKSLKAKKGLRADDHLSALTTFGVGCVAGGISAVVSHPIDTVKSNMQGLTAARYGGSSLRCARTIIESQGIKGLYKGLAPRCTRVCLEIGLHFSLYNELCKLTDNMW